MIKLSITMTTGFLSCVHNQCPILVNLNQTVKGSMRVFGRFYFIEATLSFSAIAQRFKFKKIIFWCQFRFLWGVGSGRSRFDSQTGISESISDFIQKWIYQENVYASVL